MDSEVDQLIETLRKDPVVLRFLTLFLNVKLTLADGRSFTSIALNEATIKRNEKTMAKQMFALMMSCLRASVVMGCRCQRLQDQRPTINLLGGAVLHPTIEALQLTEIASLNNRVPDLR